MRIQPVNFERHRHTLENAIHRKIGDIALVLQLIICEGNPDNLTMQLSRNRIMTWERTEDQLIMEAFMNSSRKMPPRLYLGSDRRPEFPYYEGVFLPDEKGRPTKIAPWNPMEGRTGYLLTTTGRINGAAAFFILGLKIFLRKNAWRLLCSIPKSAWGNDSSGSLRQCRGNQNICATHQCHLWRRGDVVGQSILLSQEPETAAAAVKLTCDRK